MANGGGDINRQIQKSRIADFGFPRRPGSARIAVMRPTTWHHSAKVWLFAVAATMLGAAITPWAYNIGKALAEVTDAKVTNGVVELVAHWCRLGGISWFFKVSWVFSAVLLAIPLAGWMFAGHPAGMARARLRWRGVTGVLTGLLAAGTLAAAVGGALTLAGAFVWRGPDAAAWQAQLPLLPWLLGAVILQELGFRGMALGIFLRNWRPASAILQAAVLGALVMVLLPPGHAAVGNPERVGAGFELLAGQLERLADPARALGVLFPAVVLGVALGLARWRTRALWLPIGFHAGWVLANQVFLTMAAPMPQPDPIARALTGATLTQGLFAAVALALAGVVFHLLTSPPRDDAS
jgi:membrane protease YdiL (CAAX protease family)